MSALNAVDQSVILTQKNAPNVDVGFVRSI